MGGAFILQTILTVLFMPESAYQRPRALNIDTSDKAVMLDEKTEKAEHTETARRESAPSEMEPRKTFMRELLPYDGYWDQTSYWRTLILPFFMLASPMMIWGTLLFTICISWLVLISITLSQIFSAPPYNFSVAAVGAANVSSFVATLLATAVAGPLVDGVAKYMSRRNKGIFGKCKSISPLLTKIYLTNRPRLIEPEFRLPVMSSLLLFTASGFFAWGQSLDAQDPWPVPIIVCMGLINLGVQLSVTSLVVYIIDSHRRESSEAFALMNAFKNVFAL